MQTHQHSPDSTPVFQGEILDQFYAPVQFDALTLLVSEFERLRSRIIDVHGIVSQERVSGVMGYFFNVFHKLDPWVESLNNKKID